jgi:hypothetical protein
LPLRRRLRRRVEMGEDSIKKLWPNLERFLRRKESELYERQDHYQEVLRKDLQERMEDPYADNPQKRDVVSEVEVTAPQQIENKRVIYVGVDNEKHPEIGRILAGTPEEPSRNIFREAVENISKE